MSDCSTTSMLPKDPPKTCGNCGNLLSSPNWRNATCVAIVIQGETFAGYAQVDMDNFGSCESCEKWIPRSQDTLEQRICHRTCGMCQHQDYCHTSDENSLAESCARFWLIGTPAFSGEPSYFEQRYQQLEQVAKELCRLVIEHNGTERGQKCGGIDISRQCEQLEALGVQVDV